MTQNVKYRIRRNKRPGHLIFRNNKTNFKTHQDPSVLCTPPFEKSSINTHRFCVLPPLKNPPSTAIGFVYSPLWEIIHHSPSVLCTTPFEKVIHQHPSVLCTPPFEKVTHHSPLALCTPPFEKSPITAHRFCVLPPLKNQFFWWALIWGWAFISANTISRINLRFFLSKNKWEKKGNFSTD